MRSRTRIYPFNRYSKKRKEQLTLNWSIDEVVDPGRVGAVDPECVEDCDTKLGFGLWRLRDVDRGEGVLSGDAIFKHQFLTSPVAPACTMDDDSNGSIALDRFNFLKV